MIDFDFDLLNIGLIQGSKVDQSNRMSDFLFECTDPEQNFFPKVDFDDTKLFEGTTMSQFY